VKLVKTAPQKVMWTLGTKAIVRATMAALIMIVKRPMVSKINGKDKIVAIGFTIALTREKTTPART
jgi:hypothetical protein